MAQNPEVKVTLTAEDQGLSAALRQLTEQLKNVKARTDETAGSTLRLKDAFKGLVAAIAIDRFVEVGKDVFNAGVNIARMMQMTGVSAGTLSAAYYKSSEELGIGTDVVDKAFVRLSKSIIEFQQGSSIAVKAFGQLGIKAKDFNGLSTDEKIKLVTNRLGEMKDSTEKAGLAQLILSRSGAQALPVLNALANEGFAEATAEAKKFGLYLDDQGAQAFLNAKQVLGDLQGEVEGAATQFEVGLIPALSNVAAGIADAISGSGSANGFLQLGQEVGKVVQGLVYGLTVTGAKIGEVVAEMEVTWDAATSHMKAATRVFFDAVTGNFGDAIAAKKEWDASLAGKDLHGQIQAIQKQFAATRDQANLDIFGGAGGTVHRPRKQTEPPAETSDQLTEMKIRQEAAADELAKAQAERSKSANDNELEIEKAGFAQQEELLKGRYDRAEISTAEYFAARLELVKQQAAAEVAELQKQIEQQQELEKRAHDEAAANRKRGADESLTPALRNAYTEQAGRQDLEGVTAGKAVANLQAQIQKIQIGAQTELGKLKDDQATKDRENAQKRLEFEQQLLSAQGETYAEAIVKIQQEAEEYRRAGGTAAEVNEFIRQKTAQAKFEDTATDTQQGLKSFDVQKQSISIEQKGGKINRLTAEQELNQLIAARLPLLEKQAQEELAAAKASGNLDDIAKAQNDVIAVQNLKASTQSFADQVKGPISQSFTQFFDTVGRGTMTVQRSFEGLAAGIVQSLEKALESKVFTQLASMINPSGGTGGISGFFGGLFSSIGGHARGGHVRGKGTSTSDSIPAMLSHGEYVLNARATSAIGVHNLDKLNFRHLASGGLVLKDFHAPTLHLAEGGMVPPPGQSSANVNMHVGLDEGLVLRHLSTKAAGRIVLNHLATNPKAAGKAISRAS